MPVERRYPTSGKVPTKIGGFGSKLALLKEALVAASGGHTPDHAVRGRPGWLPAWAERQKYFQTEVAGRRATQCTSSSGA